MGSNGTKGKVWVGQKYLGDKKEQEKDKISVFSSNEGEVEEKLALILPFFGLYSMMSLVVAILMELKRLW